MYCLQGHATFCTLLKVSACKASPQPEQVLPKSSLRLPEKRQACDMAAMSLRGVKAFGATACLQGLQVGCEVLFERMALLLAEFGLALDGAVKARQTLLADVCCLQIVTASSLKMSNPQ
jgi:hypothetical protein